MSFLQNPIQAFRSYFGGGNAPPPDPNMQDPMAQGPPQGPQPPMGQPGQMPGMGMGQQQPPQEQPAPPPMSTQLRFSDAEARALRKRIEEDYAHAIDDHQVRMIKCADQERQWREIVGMDGGEQGKSNFRVPLVTALCFAKHAREVEALFGTKASIAATPQGPTDSKISKRVGLAMSWQLYENMKALRAISLWILRRLKHGRSFLFCPWVKKSYNKTVNGKTERVVYWEGPDPYPQAMDDIILPASVEGKTNFDSVQSAEFVIRRYWDSPTNMLRMESEPGGPQNPEGDWYQGISANWDKIVRFARSAGERDSQKDPSRLESDRAEGVDRNASSSMQREQLEIHEWHGKWRRWIEDEPEEEYGDDMGDGDLDSSGADPGMGGGMDDGSSNFPGPGTAAQMEEGGGSIRPNSAPDSEGTVSRPMGGGLERGSGDADYRGTGTPGEGEGDEYAQMGGEAEELSEAGSTTGQTFGDGTFIDTDGQRKSMVESDLIIRFVPRLSELVGGQDASEVYPDTPNKRPILECSLLNDGQYWGMGLIELSQEIEKEMTILVNRAIQAAEMSMGPPIFAEPNVGENIGNRKYEAFDVVWVANAAGVKQLDIRPNLEPFNMLWQMFSTVHEMLTGITAGVMGRSQDQPNAPRTLGGQRLQAGSADIRLALDMRMLSESLKEFLTWVWDLWRMFGSEEQFFRVAEGDAQGLFEHGEVEGGFAKLGAKEREGNYDFTLDFADDLQVREGKKQEMIALAGAVAAFPLVQTNMVVQYRMLVDMFDAFGLDFTKYSPEPPPPFLPLLPEEEWNKALQGEEISVHPNDDDQAHIDAHESRLLAMYSGNPEDRDHDAMGKMITHIQQHQEQMLMKQQMQELVSGITGMMQAAQGVTPGQPGQVPGMPMQPGAGGQVDPMQALLAGLQGAAGQGQQAPGGMPGQPGMMG